MPLCGIRRGNPLSPRQAGERGDFLAGRLTWPCCHGLMARISTDPQALGSPAAAAAIATAAIFVISFIPVQPIPVILLSIQILVLPGQSAAEPDDIHIYAEECGCTYSKGCGKLKFLPHIFLLSCFPVYIHSMADVFRFSFLRISFFEKSYGEGAVFRGMAHHRRFLHRADNGRDGGWLRIRQPPEKPGPASAGRIRTAHSVLDEAGRQIPPVPTSRNQAVAVQTAFREYAALARCILPVSDDLPQCYPAVTPGPAR